MDLDYRAKVFCGEAARLPRLKTVLLTPLEESPADPITIAIFGASGTAGDGILKATLASPDIEKIHVITRRATRRIEEGAASRKVQMTQHMDYLDYSAVLERDVGARKGACRTLAIRPCRRNKPSRDRVPTRLHRAYRRRNASRAEFYVLVLRTRQGSGEGNADRSGDD